MAAGWPDDSVTEPDAISGRTALGNFGERVAVAHLCATGQTYGDPAGPDDPI